jgi:potassium efflux system protein
VLAIAALCGRAAIAQSGTAQPPASHGTAAALPLPTVEAATLAAVGVAELPPPPSIAELEARIADLAAAGEPAASEVEQLQGALAALRLMQTEQAAAADSRRALAEAPAALETLRAQIAAIDPTPERFARLGEETIAEPFESIQRQAEQAARELANAREAVAVRGAARERRTARRAVLQQSIDELAREGAAGAETLGELLAGDPDARRAGTVAALASFWSLLARSVNARVELEQIDATTDLSAARTTLAQLQAQAAENADAAWRQVLTARGEQRAREQEAAAREAAASMADRSPTLRRIAEENLALSERFGALSKLIAESDSIATELRREAVVIERMVVAEERRQMLDSREVVGGLFLRTLPRVADIATLERQLQADRLRRVDLDLRVLELRERVEDLHDLPAVAGRLLATAPPPDEERAATTLALLGLLETQRDQLIPQLIDENRRASAAIEQIDAGALALLASLRRYRVFIQTNLFTLRTNDPLTLRRVPAALGDLRAVLLADDWRQVPESMLRTASDRPGEWILALLLLAMFVAVRRWCLRVLAETSGLITRIATDRFALTLKALLATLLIAAPLPLLLLFMVRQSRFDPAGTIAAGDFGQAIFDTIPRVLPLVTLLCLLIAITRRGGLGEGHFRTEPSVNRGLRGIAWLVLLTVPPLVVLSRAMVVGLDMTDPQGVSTRAEGNAAQAVMLVAATINAVAFAVLLHPRIGTFRRLIAKSPDAMVSRTRWLWYPLVLLALALPAYAAWGGYGFAAFMGIERIAASLWVLLLVAYGRLLLVRWLSATSRRIAAEQLTARREAAARESAETARSGGETPSEFDETTAEQQQVDLAALNEQTMRIIRSGALTGLVIGLLVVWADTLPAFGWMRTVDLWSTMREVPSPSGEGTVPAMVPVSLFDLGASLIALLLTIIVTRNIPGLVELVVLSRLPLSPGARYAIVTLTRYLLAIVGGSIFLSLLGVTWHNIQWIVGAAVVGLAFGFQEIVKNFVSGVILLIEQPIRVGDIVTVSGTTGRVTRISLRATTVIDWDRKELVIPNSGFITSQFTNWTLTDMRTRQVITVGVAYGSDYRLVERLLVAAALQHPDVSRDPAPSAVLSEFADSSVNFNLRLVVDDVSKMAAASHATRLAIADTFARNGISIPFPQRDLHLRSVDPAAAAALREPKP